MMQPMTTVVKNILIINVLFYIGVYSLMPPLASDGSIDLVKHFMFRNFGLWYPDSGLFQPWQLVTHMFMHDPASITHILFNMFAVYMFGSALENVWGTKKFLIFYMLTGIGAGLIYFAFQVSIGANFVMYGASGAVFGLLAGFAMLFPDTRLMLLFPPIPIKAKYFVIGYAVMELYLMYSQKPGDNVAHLAHLAGALVGFLLIKYWENKGQSKFDHFR